VSSTGWGRATWQAILWSTASFVGGRALTFVSIVILARLLTPSEFGVVAAVSVFLAMLDVISDVGMKATVVYEQERGITERVHTAFTVNVAFATILAIGGVLLAPLIAQFFSIGHETGLFRLGSLNLLVVGLGNVHDALLLRELDFRRRIVPDLGRGIVRGAVSITLALSGMGAEALIIGMLAGSATWTVLQWIITPFRPSFTFDAAIARSMAAYGSGAAILSTVASVFQTVLLAVIGRALGAQALGLYTVARRVPELVVETVAFNVSWVAFPALARKRATDEEGLGGATLTVLRYQALYAGPAGAGLAVLASPLVVVLFSPKWHEAGPVLSAVAVLATVGSISFPLGDLLKAVGKQRFLIALNLIQMPIVAAGIALLAPYGIVAAAWLTVGSTVAFNAGVMVIVSRDLGVDFRSVLAGARPGIVAATGVAIGAGAVRLGWPQLTIGPLVAGMFAGTVGGLVFLRALAPGVLSEVASAVGMAGKLPGSRRAPARPSGVGGQAERGLRRLARRRPSAP
jgi:O-antigen/teichoic acid export membrane protein